jgi:hypothetical protein
MSRRKHSGYSHMKLTRPQPKTACARVRSSACQMPRSLVLVRHIEGCPPSPHRVGSHSPPVPDSLSSLPLDSLDEIPAEDDEPALESLLLSDRPGDASIGQPKDGHVPTDLTKDDMAVPESRRPARAEQQAEAVVVGHLLLFGGGPRDYFFFFLNSHGGIGFGSAHKPFFTSRASTSAFAIFSSFENCL